MSNKIEKLETAKVGKITTELELYHGDYHAILTVYAGIEVNKKIGLTATYKVWQHACDEKTPSKDELNLAGDTFKRLVEESKGRFK